MTTYEQLTGISQTPFNSIMNTLGLATTADPRTAIYRIIENFAVRYQAIAVADRPERMSIIKEAQNVDIDTQVRTFTIKFDLHIQAIAVEDE
jgi:hypothetical protein